MRLAKNMGRDQARLGPITGLKICFTHAYGNFTTKEKSALPISTENMFEKKDSTKQTLSIYIEDDIEFA